MITRTAIFEGRIEPGREEEFFHAVEHRLAPLWAAFPHALAVRWSRVAQADAEAPPVVLIQQVDYPSLEAVAAALASPARDRARAATLEVLQMFTGRFYHFVGPTGPLEGAGQG